MSEIFLTRRGGDTPLNFKIRGGTAEPASPAANTIWVNTGDTITGWTFAAAAPSEPFAGMVWFQIGTSSGVAFNAIKKNGIEIYPVGCKQYLSGTWESKSARTYLGGGWVDWWNGELFANGNQYPDVTGGWTSTAVGPVEDENILPVLSFEGAFMDAAIAESNVGGTVHTVNKIDLTEYSGLVLEFEWVSGEAHVYDALYICEEIKDPYRTYHAAKSDYWGTNTTVTLDVSAYSGSYYVCIGMHGKKTMRVKRLQMIRAQYEEMLAEMKDMQTALKTLEVEADG